MQAAVVVVVVVVGALARAFANFHDVNAPIIADFIPPV